MKLKMLYAAMFATAMPALMLSPLASADISVEGSSVGNNLTVSSGNTATNIRVTGTTAQSIQIDAGATADNDNASSNYAIVLDGNLDSLTNNGTITATPVGDPDMQGAIDMDGDFLLDSFINSGSVIGDPTADGLDAISIEGTVSTFTNTDTGQLIGGDDGVRIDGGTYTGHVGTLSNAGLIKGKDDDGIQIDDATVNNLNNSGLIVSEVDNGIEIDASSILSLNNSGAITAEDDGLNLDNAASIDTLNNSGQITALNGDGIDLIDGSILSTITNNNIIIGGDVGIEISDSSIALLTNSGIITGQGDDAINLDSSTIHTLNNLGTIDGEVDTGLDIIDSTITTLNNSGTITGITDGIYLDNSTISSLTNSDSITASGSGDGIDLTNGTTITSLNNTGTISGTDNGLELSDTGTLIGLLNNTQTISGGDSGLDIRADAAINSLDNSGTIIGLDDDGLRIDASTITLLDNSGTIEGAGASGFDTSGIYASDSTITTLINSSMNSIRGTDHGIYLDTGTINDLTNTGLIYGGDSPSTTSDDTDSGITVTGAGSLISSLTNSGIISGYDGDADSDASNDGSGIIIDSGGVITTLDNSGTIIGDDYAIYVSSGTLTTLNNSGILNGDIDLDSSTTNLNIIGDNARIIGSTIGTDTTVNINGNFSTEGSFDILTMNIDANGDLSLNHDIAGNLTNNGALQISPNSINTINIDGSLTQNSGATMFVDYDQNLSPGNEGTNSDLLVITGSADISGTVRFISKDMIDAASTNPIRIIDTSGGATFIGTIDGIKGNFEELSAAGHAGSLGFAGFATDPNPVAVNASDSIALNNSALFLSGSCGFSSNNEAEGRSAGTYRHSHSDCLTPSRNLLSYTDGNPAWGRIILSQGSQQSEPGISGYDFNTIGLIAGRSRILDEHWSEGFSIGLINSKAEKHSWGTDQADSIYVGWQRDYLEEDRFYNFSLAIGYNQFDLERRVSIDGVPVTSSARPHAWTLAAKATIGEEWQTEKDTYARPSASLSWSRMQKSAYQETGAGDFSLKLDEETLDELRADVAVEVSMDQRADENSEQIDSTLALSLGISARLKKDDRRYNASFIGFGDDFTIQGDDENRILMRYGIGWTRHYSPTSNFFIGLDGAMNNDYHEHQLNVGFRHVW
ncbi:autotransporter outer membrane beta-barrel domain-containing protein [Amphritea balenae]|uniref:Autotransporter domain-containing protein n=1 Tax=Amphritea balenae TaxID=452629 RepID=A0A3P1SXX2_9GAMM|nr:autotransporter domain-containing protein [Amphritea balenae]RRD01406.1 autotransporter domain-containing protein [Amphritea balenae]GGK57373.1 hypothetical protein GCM10007941_04400 [Amphritea balenae]